MKPKYSIKLKTIRRLYTTSWKPFLNEVEGKRRGIRIIKSELTRIKNMRGKNRTGKKGFRQTFVYGLFLDNELVDEFKI